MLKILNQYISVVERISEEMSCDNLLQEDETASICN